MGRWSLIQSKRFKHNVREHITSNSNKQEMNNINYFYERERKKKNKSNQPYFLKVHIFLGGMFADFCFQSNLLSGKSSTEKIHKRLPAMLLRLGSGVRNIHTSNSGKFNFLQVVPYI